MHAYNAGHTPLLVAGAANYLSTSAVHRLPPPKNPARLHPGWPALPSHRHLQLVCYCNEANQAHVAQYSELIMSHLSAKIQADDTLAALYEGNMAQMQTVTPVSQSACAWAVCACRKGRCRLRGQAVGVQVVPAGGRRRGGWIGI